MKIRYVDKPFPYAIITNFYTKNELETIWDELKFLTKPGKLLGPEYTLGATEADGSYKKKNTGLFLYAAYSNHAISDIIRLSRKLFDKNLCDELSKYHYIFDYIHASSRDNILLNYYEDGDYYKSHKDKSCITAITTVFKEPRVFEGGVLSFTNFNHSIDLPNNSVILFQGMVAHEVSRVKIKPKDRSPGNGRYSIVNFMDFAG